MKRTVLSFSGGKDSSFALYKLQKQNIEVARLVTTISRDSGESVAHGETIERLEEQAERIGIPIDFISTDFKTYTDDFIKKIKEIKVADAIDTIAFGDIYLEGHREWGEKLAEAVGLRAYYPLWIPKNKSVALLHEFVEVGFKSKIIKIDEEKLPAEWIGREIDESFIHDILKYDVCPLGESGEYHTYVYGGPIFKK